MSGDESGKESSSDKAAEEEDAGEEGLEDVGAVAIPEAIVIKEEPRLATPHPVLAVVPPSPSKVSTEREDAIPPPTNHYTGLPAQSPVSA